MPSPSVRPHDLIRRPAAASARVGVSPRAAGAGPERRPPWTRPCTRPRRPGRSAGPARTRPRRPGPPTPAGRPGPAGSAP
ncbi:hypothetical protein ACFFX0_15440 [Citricoccus parietis]|uniref:Uncharacterized protein n=1 Tax=Citricoccus parietis TaxID=592307 RepID=A0ABV5G1J2_9MICC